MSLLLTTISLAQVAGGLALQHASATVKADFASLQQLLRQENSTETPDKRWNLCLRSRLAPQFFLIGVPSGGQVRFFDHFSSSPGVVSYLPGDGEPEWHAQEPWIFADGFDASYTDEWLSHYPACDQSKRMVGIDCTPGYFADPKAPNAIASTYGQSSLRAKNSLQFMVLLREPVARLHSHYYHYIEDGVLKDALPDCPSSIFPHNFYVTVRNMLDKGTVCNCPCDNMLTDSTYVESFKRYFANFMRSQFHVVPYDKLNKKVVNYAWDMLGVPHGKEADFAFVQPDINPHPDIVTELDEDTLLQLEAYMDRVAGAKELAGLFAGSGINLFEFEADIHDGGSIERWLKVSWGHSA